MAPSLKELHRLMKSVDRISNKQATISNVDWEGEFNTFTLTISPNDGLYKSGKFDFMVTLPDNYPASPPTVWCTTDIYHPNIDNTEFIDPEEDPCRTNVCLNLLEGNVWASSNFGLEGVVHGLLFLMHHPNKDDPLSPHFDSSADMDSYIENVHKFMTGEPIDDGTTFEPGFKVINGVFIDTNVKTGDENLDKIDDTASVNKINETLNNSRDDQCKNDNTHTVELISPENVEVTNTIDLNIQNGEHVDVPEDIDDEFLPVKVISFDGEFLMVEDLNEDFERENQNEKITNENDNVINSEIDKIATSEPNEIADAISENDIKGEMCNITNMETQTCKKPNLTCGVWYIFKTCFTNLLNEFVKVGTKNDVML
ncbi:NEDD8-conjugating protein ubc12 [Mactra antiquata]